MNTYALSKLVHVVAVIARLGGALPMSLPTWRIVRAGDRDVLSGRLNAVYVVLLGSVAAVMVLRPTL